MELCPALELAIPVGKDSLSMASHKSVSPVSLVVTAFAPVSDVRAQLTPLLSREGETELWLIGLGAGRQRMGGSILVQCHPEAGGNGALPAFRGEGDGAGVPDIEDPRRLRAFFELIRDAREAGLLRAYHDRSDGGALDRKSTRLNSSH